MASPILQALTTTFTPAASCLKDIYQWRTTTTGQLSGEGFIYFSLGPWPPGVCMPKGWAVTSQFYSPGVCPAGYTVACSSLALVGTVTETRATYYPSLYQCQTDTDWPWYSTNRCVGTASRLPSLSATITIVDTVASTTSTSIKRFNSYDGINANAVSIRFQSGDFPPNTGIITPIWTRLGSESSSGPSSTSVSAPASIVLSSMSILSELSIRSTSLTTSLVSSSISSLSLNSSANSTLSSTTSTLNSSTSTITSTTSTTSSSPISLSILNQESSSTSSSFPSRSVPTSAASAPTTTSLTTVRGGLSPGSKAGMGVGICVGGLLVTALAILMFRRRTRTIKQPPKRSFKYWYGTGPARLGVPVELGVSRSSQWYELGNGRPPAELQGDWGHPSRSWI